MGVKQWVYSHDLPSEAHMPSPFPGMDPYLERPSLWSDFHATLLVAIRAALNTALPPRYAAFILASARREGPRYLRIVDQERHRVVTVLELLGPSNKETGADRDAYLAKRNEYLATGTNLVEIDLLRAGQRPPTEEPASIASDYLILVSPASDFPRAGLWTFSVRDPLPLVTVPLGRGEEPVKIDLKRCLDRTYDESPYHRVLDYTRPPVPPLTAPDATWAQQLLAQHGHPGASS
jgi:hypothetical protein